MENSVFNRTSYDSTGKEINTNLYNLVLGLVLCWGFLLNWIMVKTIPYETIASINPLMFFLGYIGFDWSRANSIPKTLDNAVDSAASLYMDIINLFLRILRIMGRRQ